MLHNYMRTLAHRNERLMLQKRLFSVQPEDRPLWGIMSAAEMVCHLRGAVRLAMGEIPAEPVILPIPRVVLKTAALWIPVPWRKNFQTVPALKRGAPATLVRSFVTDRSEAVSELERFCRPEQARIDHAFFGPMSFRDWMRWGYLHTDHHLRQFGR